MNKHLEFYFDFVSPYSYIAHKEIIKLVKNNSLKDIEKISGELVSSIVKDLSGNDLNRSSVEAVLKEVSKQKLMKYL